MTVVTRHMDLLEYSVLKGFSGRERIQSVVVDPSKVSGMAADPLNNYWIGAGTILTPVATNKHTVLGGWVTGETEPEGFDETVVGQKGPISNQAKGNNGTAPTAQVQGVALTGSPTGGGFTLVDENGSETGEIKYNATAAEVQAALRALPKSSGGYTAAGGALPTTAVKVTTASGLLGVKRTLKVGQNKLTGGTSPNITITQETEGQYISGILMNTLRFFDLTSGSAQAAAMYVHSCVFDTTRIQNYAFYANALAAALPTCRFE